MDNDNYNNNNNDINFNSLNDNNDLNINYTINCDDCFSRDKKSCSKCKNCGFCISSDDDNGICVFGDYKGPIKKPHYIHYSNDISKNFLDQHPNYTNDYDNNLYDNISSYCYKWIYQPDDFTYDSHEIIDDNLLKLNSAISKKIPLIILMILN